MGKRIDSWLELFLSLREAFIGVMQAELKALRLDFELSKRQLGRAIGFAALTVFVVFWAIGVGVLLLIQVASVWLPPWAATLSILTLLVIVGVILLGAARRSLHRIETPKAMIRRHVQEHMDWWEDEILPGADVAEVGSVPASEISAEHDTKGQ